MSNDNVTFIRPIKSISSCLREVAKLIDEEGIECPHLTIVSPAMIVHLGTGDSDGHDSTEMLENCKHLAEYLQIITKG